MDKDTIIKSAKHSEIFKSVERSDTTYKLDSSLTYISGSSDISVDDTKNNIPRHSSNNQHLNNLDKQYCFSHSGNEKALGDSLTLNANVLEASFDRANLGPFKFTVTATEPLDASEGSNNPCHINAGVIAVKTVTITLT